MRTIYQTTSLGDAELLRVELRSRGIDSALHNELGALYAAGMPIPAIPFEVAVADEDADTALQTVRELFSKNRPRPPQAPLKMVQSLCAGCGKPLEVPEGEETQIECPWCGRDSTLPPRIPVRRSKPLKVFAILALLALAALAIFRGTRDSSPEPSRADILQAIVGKRAVSLSQAEAIRVDPEAIARLLAPEFPKVSARYEQDFATAGNIERLAKACVDAYAELGPDWALDLGLADSDLLTRYTPDFYKVRALFEAIALKRVRILKAEAPSLDADLLERWLEGDLAWFTVHGPHPDDPRQPYAGITASFALLESGAHATLARRLAQVPDVLREARSCLKDPPKLWIEWALYEIPGVLELLKRFENAAPEATSAARAALDDYRADLKALLPTAGPVRVDPRWLSYLVREAEFTGLAPADLARSLWEEANEAHRRLNEMAAPTESELPKQSFDELVQAHVDAETRARDLAVQSGYLEASLSIPVEIAPPHFRNWPGSLYYVSRPFSPVLRSRLYVEPWPNPRSPRPGSSPDQLLIMLQGETWPGRHLWRLRARGHASLMKRVYGNGVAEAGWACYVRQDVQEVAKRERLIAIWTEAWWGLLDLAISGGVLKEDEAVDFLQEWGRLERPDARRQVAFLTTYPLQYAGAAWTAREIRRTREDVWKSEGRSDLRRFNESVMDYGSTPIALIRQELLRRK